MGIREVGMRFLFVLEHYWVVVLMATCGLAIFLTLWEGAG